MANIKFKIGIESNLPAQYDEGSLYFCKDTGGIYVDFADSDGTITRKNRLQNFPTRFVICKMILPLTFIQKI